MKAVKEMNRNYFYSIIVPIYNTPIAYLEKCMSSLLNQTYKEIEIIHLKKSLLVAL